MAEGATDRGTGSNHLLSPGRAVCGSHVVYHHKSPFPGLMLVGRSPGPAGHYVSLRPRLIVDPRASGSPLFESRGCCRTKLSAVDYRLGRVNVGAGDVAAGIVNQHKLSLHKCLQVLGGLMMPAATSRSVMSIDPAKVLSHHDRVNHIEDAAGIVVTQCCLSRGGVAELPKCEPNCRWGRFNAVWFRITLKESRRLEGLLLSPVRRPRSGRRPG